MNVPFLDLQRIHEEVRVDLQSAFQRVLDRGWFILGPEVEAFEHEYAQFCGARHCVGMGNGLDALRILLEAAKIGAGDEVIVPAQTFIATWLAVTAVGATPVPADVGVADANLDPQCVEDLIGPRTRAIIAVHLFGRPADLGALREIAARKGLMLFEDAAQAHGAVYDGMRAGNLADAAAFSFYPAKNLGALGDGGAITTNDDQLAAAARRLRNYGSVEKYRHDEIGWNSRLDELQAAMLRVLLPRVESWNTTRRERAATYSNLLGTTALGLPPPDDSTVQSSWHLYVVTHQAREQIRIALRERGVETSIHYPVTPGRSGAYSSLTTGKCARAEWHATRCLSLPIGPYLTQAQTEFVCAELIEVLSRLPAR